VVFPIGGLCFHIPTSEIPKEKKKRTAEGGRSPLTFPTFLGGPDREEKKKSQGREKKRGGGERELSGRSLQFLSLEKGEWTWERGGRRKSIPSALAPPELPLPRSGSRRGKKKEGGRPERKRRKKDGRGPEPSPSWVI